MKITSLKAKEIKDSRGNPTIEVEIGSGDIVVKASVPSGRSAGSREALEKRDADGKGVQEAIKNVNEIIAPAVLEKEVDPTEIDKILLKLDGTKNKSNLGANAILGVSLAVTRLGAKLEDKPLWKYINKISGVKVIPSQPKLFMNVLNGGAHAGFRLPFQEYIVVPGGKTTKESYEKSQVFLKELGEAIEEKYGKVEMGDEGGFSPKMETIEEPFELLSNLMDDEMVIANDVAASEFYKDGVYHILGEEYSSSQFLNIYKNLVENFPIGSLEDPFEESDSSGFESIMRETKSWNSKAIKQGLAEEILIVGDDLTTTNPEFILDSARNKRANAVIIKPNQIGTLTEVYNAVKLARGAGWKIICSHRSGETMDSFIADLAVGIGAYGLKAGSPSQEVREVKYLRLLEIEEEMKKI
ncbi:phosphopyruvate hydratase [Patescibacteria group bacterium]|nr:phosphopyruvate hydratase [Patescibacteria group bacterium]MCG2694886.1 phosphopyruvate hydratase [Candidatus Parcubacteria bacterium]